MASDDNPPSRTPADAADRCVRELTFDDEVYAVDWSPDGTRLAIGNGGVEVLTPEGRRLWRRGEHPSGVCDLRWSPDGRQLASYSDLEVVRILDAQEGTVLIVGPSTEEGSAISWSPDGRRIACGCGPVIILDTETGENVETWIIPSQSAWGVSWSLSGSYLAIGFCSGQIQLRDEQTRRELDPFEGHTKEVSRLAWTRDSQRLASASFDNTARVWNIAESSCTLVLKGHRDSVHSVSWSPDGTLLATSSDDRTVRIWSSENGEEVTCLTGHTQRVLTVAFSPDGFLVASASDDGTVRIWDVSDLYPVRPGRDVSASFDDYVVRQAATVGRRARRTAPSLWVPRLASASGAVLGEFKSPGGWVGSVDIFPDSGALVIGSSAGSLQMLDLKSGSLSWDDPGEGYIYDTKVSPDGSLVASSSGASKNAKIVDASTGESVSVLVDLNDVSSVTWSPDSNLIAAASFRHASHIFEARSGKLVCQFPGHARNIDWSSTGRLLATGSYHTVRFWKPTNGAELYQHELHQAEVNSVCWSPDGQLLASASSDGKVIIWDDGIRRERTRWDGHEDQVDCVVWSPDQCLLASGARGRDKSIRLWNLETGREVHRFPFEEDLIWRLAWAPNGAFLAASIGHGVVRLWDVRKFLRPQPRFQPAPPKPQPLPLDLKPLPAAFAHLTRLALPFPLSHLRVLLRVISGTSVDDATIEPLTSHPGIRQLAALRWPVASRPGLVDLLLKDVPRHDEWKPPPDATPTQLRDALADALAGQTTTPDAPTLPIAALLRSADAIDERLLTLLELVGPDAVAADPSLPLRLLPQVSKLPAMTAPERRLLGLRLRLDEGGPVQGYGPGIDRTGISLRGDLRSVLPSQLAFPEHVFQARYGRGELLYRARTGQEPPRLCPTVILLDVSPPVFGPVERTTRLAAHVIASSLMRAGVPAVLVTAGGTGTVQVLERPTDLVEIWTRRSLTGADEPSSFQVAWAMRETLRGSDVLEPVVVVLSHVFYGADFELPDIVPSGGSRGGRYCPLGGIKGGSHSVAAGSFRRLSGRAGASAAVGGLRALGERGAGGGRRDRGGAGASGGVRGAVRLNLRRRPRDFPPSGRDLPTAGGPWSRLLKCVDESCRRGGGRISAATAA